MRSENHASRDRTDFFMFPVFLLLLISNVVSSVMNNRPLWYLAMAVIVGSVLASTQWQLYFGKKDNALTRAKIGLIGLIFLEIHVGSSAVINLFWDKSIFGFYLEMALYLWIAYLIAKKGLHIGKLKRKAIADEAFFAEYPHYKEDSK